MQEGECVVSGQKEMKPAGVADLPKQAGDVRFRWGWTEPSVWTARMLAALESGVEGCTWFSLIDKVFSLDNLRSSFLLVKRNRGGSGTDGVSIAQFESNLEANLQRLSFELKTGSYEPSLIKRCYIPKGGGKELRPLGIPTIRDRVVQGALRNVLEPIFEEEFTANSYGFRPGRGCKDALREVDSLLRTGYRFVVDLDIKSYFDSIPHAPLMDRIREKVSDGRVLQLVEKYLQQGILDRLEEWTPETGTPQGAVISPLLSNIYLHPLDLQMQQKGFHMVRYADDQVVLCKTREEAESALDLVREWMSNAGLTLHPVKTRLVDMAERGGFDFLGYHFEFRFKWPRAKSLMKLKDAVRSRTPKSNGSSLDEIIARLNPLLRGWFEYFKHGVKGTFRALDCWIRRRLRNMLRRRLRKSGTLSRGGIYNRMWPPSFFQEHGLVSLLQAHRQACQSR